jgi:hypothetical protein
VSLGWEVLVGTFWSGKMARKIENMMGSSEKRGKCFNEYADAYVQIGGTDSLHELHINVA